MNSRQQNSEDPSSILVVKYGGNAMVSDSLQREVLSNICSLTDKGFHMVIVHGGGPFIEEALEDADIESEFIGGQRKTTPETYKYVEMALKGRVNGRIVNIINQLGYSAVGLSGKDGKSVIARKRYHKESKDGEINKIDLGQVGEVESVNPSLIKLLLIHRYIPVVACVASDEDGNNFNINADIFAGSLAGALKAQKFMVLTDVDGLYEDISLEDTLIHEMKLDEIEKFTDDGIIKGGMLPKIEACKAAIQSGAREAVIINGKKPEQILQSAEKNNIIGTTIKKD